MGCRSAGFALPLIGLLALATPCAADQVKLSIAPAPEELPSQTFAMPLITFAPEAASRPRGMLLSIETAPGTAVGLGMFGTRAKDLGMAPDPTIGLRRPKTRRAGVGLSIRF